MDKKTKGIGDCFFHTIIQQLKREESDVIDLYVDHKKLRTDVCKYALKADNLNVITLKNNYNDLVKEETENWNNFFTKMVH